MSVVVWGGTALGNGLLLAVSAGHCVRGRVGHNEFTRVTRDRWGKWVVLSSTESLERFREMT